MTAGEKENNGRHLSKRSGIRGEESFSLQTFLPAPYLEGPALKGIVPPDHIASPVRAGVEFTSFRLELRHNHHDRCILLVWYFRIRLFSSGFLKYRGTFYSAKNCRMFCWQRNIEMPI